MAKREFLQLAHVYNPKKHGIAGRFVSEKLDGERAFYDGGITRGMTASQVPWANIERDKKETIATGLWSRYGKVIYAPSWWLDRLPFRLLDGELWAGREKFQTLSSVVRNKSGTSDWSGIKYMVFDSPPVDAVLGDGTIGKPGDTYHKVFKDFAGWHYAHRGAVFSFPADMRFEDRYGLLKRDLLINDVICLHEQHQLPFNEANAVAQLEHRLEAVLATGGEGLIIKNPGGLWTPERTYGMLKYKPFSDMEAKVVGYTTGRETDKGSKLLGMMGALMCEIPAGEFRVSGFTDTERGLSGQYEDGDFGSQTATEWATAHPDEVVPDWIENPRFPRGSVVTIKYRELTDGGLPKEGRFWRNYHG